jgi:hypothetical protein
VRLAAAAEVMGLAEGVESGLSAQQLFDLPVWVSLGAERLTLVRLPPTVGELHIFADADQIGQRAAARATARHERAGLKVVVRTPPTGFGDWNDVLQASLEPV